LGATLYELATGAPPFGSGDPLRLTHDHLARVPVPPAAVDAAVPEPLSEIILHLLEKEPDNRYQTADGVLHDLQRLQDSRADPAASPVHIGRGDIPLRLLPPPRLVSRDGEVATLQEAFDEALAGRCRAVLVGGTPGVGKTALIDELRPVVTRAGGWFVAGKFDQYRRDLESSGVYRAFRALGRLLLAEPEDELAKVRERIRSALGPNAGLMAAVVSEYGALLGVPADPGDPMTAQVRGQRNGVRILRAVASPERPIVLFLDDLQWVGRTPLGFVDLLLDEEPIEGLLLVAAHREHAADSADPLAGPLARWQDKPGVRQLRLTNLPAPSLVAMVAEMLHVQPVVAADLAELVGLHTSGNPYETVELLNALRRDGVLTATGTGWHWDAATVRGRLNRPEADGLLATPVAAMPARSRRVVEAMACLGGRATMSALQTATGEPAGVLEGLLAPALDEGVLVAEPGVEDAVRFRHDRIQEAVLRGLSGLRRRRLQLTMARRLARVPDLSGLAAAQYLPVIDAIDDPAERRHVVALLRRAADDARSAADHVLVSTLLGAALTLIGAGQIGTLVELRTGRQTALYSLGRLDEADEEYRAIERLGPSAVQRAEATATQVHSLTHRNLFADAVTLGVALLRELGIAVPVEVSAAEVDHQIGHLYRWLDHSDPAEELTRPEIDDPALLAGTSLIAALVPAAFFVPDDFALFLWLTLEAPRIWLDHGPARSLVGPTGVAANAATVKRDESYAIGHRAMQRVVALGEAHGYEPDTSLVRASFAAIVCWSEPIENAVRESTRAREGLLAGGDLAWAGYTYHTTVVGLLECAPSLQVYVAEVEEGLAFVRRTGNEQTGQWLDSFRWVATALRGEGGAGTAGAGDPLPLGRHADNPSALLYAHIYRAVVAAIFGDHAGLARHIAAAMPLVSAGRGHYPTALVRVLRGLALARQARAGTGDPPAELMSELDEVTQWLAARAADAPDNFLHLLRLVEAERAAGHGTGP
jgi:predicted ATPase